MIILIMWDMFDTLLHYIAEISPQAKCYQLKKIKQIEKLNSKKKVKIKWCHIAYIIYVPMISNEATPQSFDTLLHETSTIISYIKLKYFFSKILKILKQTSHVDDIKMVLLSVVMIWTSTWNRYGRIFQEKDEEKKLLDLDQV